MGEFKFARSDCSASGITDLVLQGVTSACLRWGAENTAQVKKLIENITSYAKVERSLEAALLDEKHYLSYYRRLDFTDEEIQVLCVHGAPHVTLRFVYMASTVASCEISSSW